MKRCQLLKLPSAIWVATEILLSNYFEIKGGRSLVPSPKTILSEILLIE